MDPPILAGMHFVSLKGVENNLRYADHGHPVDVIEPLLSPRREAAEALGRILIWIGQSRTLAERGYRATIVVFRVKPGAISEQTLTEIGESVGYTKQAVDQLLADFEETFGLER